MRKLTQTQKDRYERKAYMALDAVDYLVGEGLGGEATERALSAIRDIIYQIEAAELKQRGKAMA